MSPRSRSLVAPKPRPCASSAGFTLFEVLITVVLAGVITAAAATRMPVMLSSFALQNATFAVAQELRVARQRAVTMGARARVTIASDQYIRRRESPPASNTYVDDGAVETMPNGVTLSVNPSDPIFDRRGLTAQPYTVTLTDAYSNTKTVTVNGIGRVDVN
jgi:prepilin-type N-terminal cleavage/methylation domain-containing protein